MPASLSSPARGAESPRRFEHETLAFLGGLVDLSGAVFYSVDPDLNAVDHALRDVDPTLLPEYVRHFHKLDPLHPRRLAASGRSLVTLPDVVPRAALERSSYYRDFMRPLGMYHEAELVLRDGAAVVGGISLLRDESRPAFGAAELALLAKVRPYVAYAFRSRRGGAPALDAPTLTPREREVARLVCRGASNRGIGRALGIALPTVKSHLEHVYAKLGVRSRTQLVVRLGPASVGRPSARTFG
jgi:DNA-binding CsgD family transcriptional regulator